MVRLEVSARDPSGVRTGYQFEFDRDEIVLGRAADADVVLPHEGVSGAHARIRRRTSGYYLSDGGSTNGTRVNGTRVAAGRDQRLHDGDRIDIVAFTLTFREAPGGPETTAEGTASIARRMVREVLGVLGPGDEAPTLTVLDGSQAGHIFRILESTRPLTIGRAEACDLRLDDKDTSREHARLLRDWLGVAIEDLGAKNAVLIGEVPVRGLRRLHDGDVLLVGSVRLRYDDPAERYLRELEARPDVLSATHDRGASGGPPIGLYLTYLIGVLLMLAAATGLWIFLR